MTRDREPRRPVVVSGFVETYAYSPDGTRRRTGKRISYGPPCECDACLRGENS